MKILFVGDTRSHHSLREVITERSNIFYLMDAKKAIQQFDQLANGFEWLVFDNRILRGHSPGDTFTGESVCLPPSSSPAMWYGYHSPSSRNNPKEQKK